MEALILQSKGFVSTPQIYLPHYLDTPLSTGSVLGVLEPLAFGFPANHAAASKF